MTSTDRIVDVVDDDPSIREALSSLLRAAGWRTEAFASAEAFLRHSRPAIPSCLVLDAWMPGMGGLGLQRQLSERHDAIPIVFISGLGDAGKGGTVGDRLQSAH
jgi:FixJ family two-component response regulator